MCLCLDSSIPFNKPHRKGNIRYKILTETCWPNVFQSDMYPIGKWKPLVWRTSTRRNPGPLTRTPAYGELECGFHVYVSLADAKRVLAKKGRCPGYVIAVIEVKNFVAAGTNNGGERGEVWHYARTVGYYKYRRNTDTWHRVRFH